MFFDNLILSLLQNVKVGKTMKTYNEAKQMFENSRKRKLQNNTYLVKTDLGYGIKLHNTIVVEYQPDKVILDSGGYKTPTTKNRINEYMPDSNKWFLVQDKGVWYIGWKSFVFADGCYYQNGRWFNTGGNPKVIDKQRKAVKKYAKAFVKALFDGQVPKPSSGDCWCCGLVITGTQQPLGEATKDKNHILEYIKDNYFVPSLLVNAQKMFGASQTSWRAIGDLWNEPNCKGMNKTFDQTDKQEIEQNIRRYCYRQLGLVS